MCMHLRVCAFMCVHIHVTCSVLCLHLYLYQLILDTNLSTLNTIPTFTFFNFYPQPPAQHTYLCMDTCNLFYASACVCVRVHIHVHTHMTRSIFYPLVSKPLNIFQTLCINFQVQPPAQQLDLLKNQSVEKRQHPFV